MNEEELDKFLKEVVIEALVKDREELRKLLKAAYNFDKGWHENIQVYFNKMMGS